MLADVRTLTENKKEIEDIDKKMVAASIAHAAYCKSLDETMAKQKTEIDAELKRHGERLGKLENDMSEVLRLLGALCKDRGIDAGPPPTYTEGEDDDEKMKSPAKQRQRKSPPVEHAAVAAGRQPDRLWERAQQSVPSRKLVGSSMQPSLWQWIRATSLATTRGKTTNELSPATEQPLMPTLPRRGQRPINNKSCCRGLME